MDGVVKSSLASGRSPGLSIALCTLLAVAMVLLHATASLPQAAADLATALHVELDKPGSYSPGNRASGRITNDSDYRLTNVRLRLDASDAAGQALPPTFGWVDGDVPAHGRAWFRIPVPPNAVRVSVSVIDFNFVSIQSP